MISMDEVKNIAEREKIMVWTLIPFVFSCIALIASISMLISLNGFLFTSAFYIITSFCLFLQTLTCYMACFQHKRTAALSAAVICLLTLNWILAVLLFIGYSKQKHLDTEYGETWICVACGAKDSFSGFLYPGLCDKCARVARKESLNILNGIKELGETLQNTGKLNEQLAVKYLDEIMYIRENRGEYPMLKKRLCKETDWLLSHLIETDAEGVIDYERKVEESGRLDKQYETSLTIKKKVEKTNKIATGISFAVIICFALLIGYGIFAQPQVPMLNELLDVLVQSSGGMV